MTLKTIIRVEISCVDNSTVSGEPWQQVYTTSFVGGSKTMLDGSGTSQADLGHKEVDTSFGVGTVTRDLTTLSTGSAASKSANDSFQNVKVFLVTNTKAAGGANHMLIGGAAANDLSAWLTEATGDKCRVDPGGMVLWVSPIGVDCTTNTDLKLEAVTSAQGYQMLIVGDD